MPGRLTPLKLALLEAGTSQCDFSEEAQIDRWRLNMIANARITPTTDERIRIAKLLGRDERELFPRHPTAFKAIRGPA